MKTDVRGGGWGETRWFGYCFLLKGLEGKVCTVEGGD